VRVLVLLLLLAFPSALEGQKHHLSLEVAGSHARPPAGLDVEAGSYFSGGIRWLRSGALSLFAGGDGGWSLEGARGDWLSGYAGGHWTRTLGRHFEAHLTASAAGFRVEDPDRFDALLFRANPTLAARWGRFRWEVRLQGGFGRTEVGTGTPGVEEDVWQAGSGLGVRSALAGLTLEGSGGFHKSQNGDYRTAEASAAWGWGGGQLRFAYSWWDPPSTSNEHLVMLRVDLPLGRAVRASSAVGQSGPDPLLGTPSATYASAGISVELLEALRPPETPVVRLLEGSPRRARFVVQAPEARSVEVLGDFSGWEPVTMRFDGENRWVVEMELAPGLYHFGFRVDGVWWVPDDAPGRTQDEWGRDTATLVVPDA